MGVGSGSGVLVRVSVGGRVTFKVNGTAVIVPSFLSGVDSVSVGFVSVEVEEGSVVGVVVSLEDEF